MSADTILIFFFAIVLQLAKSEPYSAILLVYAVNLTATVAKFPTFKKISFYKIYFPSAYLSRAV